MQALAPLLFVYLQHDFEKGILMIHVNHQKGLRVSNTTEVFLLQQATCDLLHGFRGPDHHSPGPVRSPTRSHQPVIHDGLVCPLCTKRLFSWPKYNCLTLNYNPTQLSVHLTETTTPYHPNPAHSILRWEHSPDLHLTVTWGKIYGTGVEVHAIKIHLQNI